MVKFHALITYCLCIHAVNIPQRSRGSARVRPARSNCCAIVLGNMSMTRTCSLLRTQNSVQIMSRQDLTNDAVVRLQHIAVACYL